MSTNTMSAYETHGVPVDGGTTIADLRAIAFRVGIRDYRSMNKLELIHTLNDRLEQQNQETPS